MPQIQEEIEIDVPRADVFRFCHDVKRRPEWDVHVTRIELLTPRPIRQGTLLRIDSKFTGGSVFSWDAEYISFRLPQGSRMRVIDAASSSHFAAGSEMKWEFSSVGMGTRFTWTWDYKPRGFLATIADMLGRRSATQRGIQQSMTKLKELLESGRRASPS